MLDTFDVDLAFCSGFWILVVLIIMFAFLIFPFELGSMLLRQTEMLFQGAFSTSPDCYVNMLIAEFL